MKHVPFSPNLYKIFDTFYEMIYVTFESEGNANWPFLLQVDFLGDGSTKTNIKMKTKWLFNTSRSHPTSTPLHHTFYVMISVTFECEGNPNLPFLLQFDVAGIGMGLPISK
jgi:hypothetical protein